MRKDSFLKKNLILLAHFSIIFFAFILQTSIFPLITYLRSTPNLVLIIVFTYGLLYGENIGIIVGIVVGLLFDMYFDETFGVYVLIYSIIGYANGILHDSFYGDSISLSMILSIVNCFVFNIYIYVMHFLIRGRINIWYCLTRIIFPNIMFTLIATIIIYKFLYDFNVIRKSE